MGKPEDIQDGAAGSGLATGRAAVGLATVDDLLERVAARVKRGGHDIPEAAIRKRFDASRRNRSALVRQNEALVAIAALNPAFCRIDREPDTGMAEGPFAPMASSQPFQKACTRTIRLRSLSRLPWPETWTSDIFS